MRKDRRSRGQALLESVLVTLTFLMMLIGVLDVGQVLFVHQSLVARARAAIRYGAVRPYDAVAIQNMVLYGQPAIPASDSRVGFLGLTRSMVSVSRKDASLEGDRIVLRIHDYPFWFYTPFIAGRKTGRDIIVSMPYEAL